MRRDERRGNGGNAQDMEVLADLQGMQNASLLHNSTLIKHIFSAAM